MTGRTDVFGWLNARRPLVATVAAAGVIAAVVAVVAVVSPGYTAQKVELDDATVWVTSDLHQAAGRANPRIGELNTAIRLDSAALSVSQSGQTVVVIDQGAGEGRIVDTATAAVTDTFSLPAGDVDLALDGDAAVITARTSGDVWIVPVSSLAAFDPESTPDLTLGAGGDTALSTGGTVFAVSAATGSVVTVDAGTVAGRDDEPDAESVPVAPGDDVSITAVGERWVVLDRTSRTLLTASGEFPIAPDTPGSAVAPGDSGDTAENGATTDPTTGDGSGGGGSGSGSGDGTGDGANPAQQAPAALWLQSPSTPSDTALVATTTQLLSVALADGAIEVLSDGHSGTSTRPAEADGCWYAAWTDGRTYSRCAAGTTSERASIVGANATGDRVAGGGGVTEGELDGAASGDRLEFRSNGTDGLLLSDAASGRSWDVTRGNTPIDDWDELLPDTPTDQQSTEASADQTRAPDPAQSPPVATDDQFGARPGRSTVLPVLLNDFDPNDDVIVIDSVTLPDGAPFTVDLISDDQQLQLTLPDTAAGELVFGYTVSDGQGGSDQATVTVTVRSPEENSPPVQSRRAALDVALGGRTEADQRADWFDPDGDAIFVQSATVAAPDTVSWTPQGVVTVTDAGQTTGPKEVAVTVSDGVGSTTGSFTVEVHQPDQAPLTAEGFVVLARVGQTAEVDTLPHVTGASPALRLSNVPSRDGLEIAPDYAGGTVRITARAAGSSTLDYAVSDGGRTASGVIRVIATVPPDANSRPVTVPHSAFARQNTSVVVDVLAGDFDPAGGVLIVSGADDSGAAVTGLRVETIEQRLIRVTLTRPLDSGRVTFGYTITNGLAEASGSVTVVEIPEPTSRQPPIAVPDSAAVRVGDVVDIPVLANDVHPDGDALTLDPVLVSQPAGGGGMLFASGSRLRYLAPDTPGDVTAVYRVDAPDGQWATAQVTISVREADATANAAPVPPQLTARVIAGETVRIPVPVTGIDPDGDSVQFLGIDSVPEKGTVVQIGSDWIEFEAGDYSSGTDSFSYSVIDRLGARATGTVRVGISPRLDGARNPVATPDEVRVRPGRTVLVRVLENDSDPDGSPLRIADVTPLSGAADGAQAEEVASASAEEGGVLRIEAPEAPGRYGFIYTVENERGGTSSSFATIDVDPAAPLARPVVDDTVLTLTDILDRPTVDVDVLKNVFFAEGSSSSLGVSVESGWSEAARVVDGRIRVQVASRAQVIPFTVAHPDDPNVRSSGFIWVPGTDDALPQLRSGAPRLSVVSGSRLEIDVNDYVVAVGGRPVRIADPNSVRATHTDGSGSVIDDDTLVFQSADRYFGPASISFAVADGDGPSARTATLVLPITVTPRENQPPAFAGAVLEFEPGQQKTIDLTRLTTSPSGSTGQLSFALVDPRPAGFDSVLIGSTLTVTAGVGAVKGTTGDLGIQVAANGVPGTAGRISMTVVPSTRPPAAPATDSVIAPRGQTTRVDVLANDAATNPFPETPLRVIAVRGIDAGALPAGVVITPSADGSVLQVAVAPDAPPADVSVQYQVLDGTGELERAAWGTVRIAVIDRPAPVTGLAVTGFGDRSVTVSFSPGPANNSPISGFDLVARTTSGSQVTSSCSSTSCQVATPGNGEGNAVSISVSARNAVGSSDESTYSVPVWSDLLPSAPGTPQLSPLDGALQARWSPASVPAGGSPVRQYDVTANGRPVATVDAAGCDGSGCSVTVGGLTNGSDVQIVVTARNGAYPPLAVWPSASAGATPYGPPAASAVDAVSTPEAGPGSVTVSWPGFEGNGNAVAGYYAQVLRPGAGVPSGAQACTVSSPAPGRPTAPRAGGDVIAQQALGGDSRSAVFTGLTDVDAAYGFVVWGYNAAGCAVSAVATAVAYPTPGQVQASGVQVVMVQRGTTYEPQVLSAPTPSPVQAGGRYSVRRIDASGSPVGDAQPFTLGGYPLSLTAGRLGEVYRFQLRACNVFAGVELCGAWSDTVSAPEASLTFAFASGPTYDGTSWSWEGEPENGGLTPAYACGSREITPAGEPGGQVVTGGSCTPVVPVPTGSAGLSVQVGDHHYVYPG
ncbi:Ig-like domain-containing protein [Herbiconiux liangxiaofengii]|uniref:Ig-like domain-containing protein n=1 Tax=Herbiconiux liangxiaofengii TaxID=3342795 RepID=UPI0035B7BCE2